MNISTPRIVQNTGPHYVRWVVMSFIATIALGLAYSQVPYWVHVEQNGSVMSVTVSDREDELAQKDEIIRQLQKEREVLGLQVAALERASQVDQQSVQQVREEMKQALADRLKMEEELVFLRGLVSSGSKKEGLFVQKFGLEPGVADREFRYHFTVNQQLTDVGVVSGWIRLTLEGKVDGQTKTLALADVVADKSDRIKMRFKHFQDVEGVMTLPEGFDPANVTVEVQPNNSDLSAVKKRFDWSL